MLWSDAPSFIVTLIAMAVAPGPAALVILARSVAGDARGATGFGAGFALGGLVIISAVCFGLGAVLSSVPVFFEYAKYAMLAYMLWLAWGILKSGITLDETTQTPKASLAGATAAGFASCFISPYMMILFPLALPGLLDLSTITLPDFAIVGVVTFWGLFVGCCLIVIFAAQITRLVRSPRGMQRLNRCIAGVLSSAGLWMTFA